VELVALGIISASWRSASKWLEPNFRNVPSSSVEGFEGKEPRGIVMKYFLDLFSGIGGFALGAYWAGLRFDGHYFSEIDEYAINVYQKRFPDAVGLGSIESVRGGQLPKGEWIIAGGFPCQDISFAGKGAGLDGERSGLWFEYARLISEIRPRYAVMENVGALTVRGLDRVLGSLLEIGYDAEWQDIRASDVGAPHRRERIWIVAYPMVNTNSERREKQLDGFTKRSRNIDGENRRENVADASDSGNVRRDGELEPVEREMRELGRSAQDGCREWWSVEPDVGRVAHGIPARVDRLKCLGNSIVPDIARRIFEELKEEWN
jgi:DNA (cytosine-5)-methyltransferase 1